jgi:hypothetical protein
MTTQVPADAFGQKVLDLKRHGPIIGDIDHYARRAGIAPHDIWTPAFPKLGPDEIKYLKQCRSLPATKGMVGAYYVGTKDIVSHMALMVGCLVRALIDARMMMAQTIVDKPGCNLDHRRAAARRGVRDADPVYGPAVGPGATSRAANCRRKAFSPIETALRGRQPSERVRLGSHGRRQRRLLSGVNPPCRANRSGISLTTMPLRDWRTVCYCAITLIRRLAMRDNTVKASQFCVSTSIASR